MLLSTTLKASNITMRTKTSQNWNEVLLLS